MLYKESDIRLIRDRGENPRDLSSAGFNERFTFIQSGFVNDVATFDAVTNDILEILCAFQNIVMAQSDTPCPTTLFGRYRRISDKERHGLPQGA